MPASQPRHSPTVPQRGCETHAPHRFCFQGAYPFTTQNCGDAINCKTYSKFFKNKRRFENDRENWAIFKDAHEPTISREDFEKAQELIAKNKAPCAKVA